MSVAGITFLAAELTALNQKNVMRLFAYSTLGQLGLLFFALSSNALSVIQGGLFYLISHSLAKMTVFLALGILIYALKEYKVNVFEKFNSTFLTMVFIISFLSILGIPPFSGFVGKILILEGFAKVHNYFAIAFILGVSVIEAVYFFRLIAMMVKSKTDKTVIQVGLLNKAILTLLIFLIILFGVYPALLTHFTDPAGYALLRPDNYLQFALGVIK